jgi:polyphosphate kinase 2 (PPK2 family)
MLEKIDLALELSKKDYKEREARAGERISLLQRATWAAGIPVIILFEGWDASGKGTSINLLAQHLDPRGSRIHSIKGATPIEKQMPWLWRFWLRLPNNGEIAIFDRSWYGRVLVERVEKLAKPDVWRQAFQDILEFERALSEDGTVLIKFFLHMSKKEQKKRFKKVEHDPLEKWRVTKEDWEHHRKYGEYLIATEEMLERTETEWGSWTIVEATDRYWARIKVMETVCRRMEEALTQRNIPLPQLSEEAQAEVIEGEKEAVE